VIGRGLHLVIVGKAALFGGRRAQAGGGDIAAFSEFDHAGHKRLLLCSF
jgi:hypothetical protein